MGPNRLVASVDFPFHGWHELTICYRGQGWKLQKRRIRRDEQMTFVEDTFTRASGEQGFLMFRLYDAEGRPVDVPDDPRLSNISRYFNRLALWREDARRDVQRRFSVRDQVQVFVEGAVPFTDEERKETQSFFQDRLREQFTRAAPTTEPDIMSEDRPVRLTQLPSRRECS